MRAQIDCATLRRKSVDNAFTALVGGAQAKEQERDPQRDVSAFGRGEST